MTITRDEARAIALGRITPDPVRQAKRQAAHDTLARYGIASSSPANEPVYELHDEHTLERPFGWVFFWGARGDTTGGHRPIVVDRDGRIAAVESPCPLEPYARALENWGPAPSHHGRAQP